MKNCSSKLEFDMIGMTNFVARPRQVVRERPTDSTVRDYALQVQAFRSTPQVCDSKSGRFGNGSGKYAEIENTGRMACAGQHDNAGQRTRIGDSQ